MLWMSCHDLPDFLNLLLSWTGKIILSLVTENRLPGIFHPRQSQYIDSVEFIDCKEQTAKKNPPSNANLNRIRNPPTLHYCKAVCELFQ